MAKKNALDFAEMKGNGEKITYLTSYDYPMAHIGHIQLGDNPGRHEPGAGEINFPNLFRFLYEAGYDGWIGCEYNPAGVTEDGLGWVKPYL